MPATAKELREKRADLIAQGRKLLDERGDNFTAEDESTYQQIFVDADKLKVQYERIEKLEREEASLANVEGLIERVTRSPSGKPAGGDGAATIKVRGAKYGQFVEIAGSHRATAAYGDAFRGALSGHRLTGEQLAALQSDDDPSGGYLVASEQFATSFLKAVDDICWIRRLATVHTVREATSLGIRKRTAKASSASWGAELKPPTADTSLKFGKKVLTPHYMSQEISVSRDLLRRNVIGVEQVVMDELARDAAELEEQAYLLGDGAEKPLGVFVASNDGISTARDVATGNTSTSITGDGLRSAKYSLKSQYRENRPDLRWLFHRDGISQISKLKNTVDGGYIWQEGIKLGDPDTILGIPVAESEKVPNTFTSGLYVGMLACWAFYQIADALDHEVQRLMEVSARTNETVFLARQKTDGLPVLEEAFVRVKLG